MSELIVSLLGSLRIEHRQLGSITLTNRKVIGLLTYLLIESDRPHSRAFLLGLLWPDLPTAAAQNNLRVTWAQLQKALGAHYINQQPYIVGDRLTLRVNPLSDHFLDLNQFHQLIMACNRHSHADPASCAECATRLAQAINLVRGELLGDFSLGDCAQFDEWLAVQRESIHVQMLSALEQLASFHEQAGHLAEAEGYVRRLLTADPLRESAYRQLMRVLARADQRSAALDAYETCRRMLATELGLAPAVETVALAEQIRSLSASASSVSYTPLPPVLTRFFGRQAECTRLVELVSQPAVRLVTLIGPGGVGKTRLALEVAQRMGGVFANRLCFVELAGVTDGKSVGDAIAAALHLPTNHSRSSNDAVVDYLHDKTMLLVLDNCEHVLKACSRLVQTLCREARNITILATSRTPLRLAEEQVVRLEPLATPVLRATERLSVADSLQFDSIQLFSNRAAQTLLHFTLNDTNVHAVARICHQLDGLPLAIEIAAAQTRALPINAIAERLDQCFAWQNRRNAATISRQQTLHTLIDWSYNLLSAQERTMLRRLAVFAGGWTLEAAEAVSPADEACDQILAELVDHSLVVFGADSEHRRYSMHETIRQFAQQQLRGNDHEAEARERHARYYAQMVLQAAENSTGLGLAERLRLIRDDHDNLRRAFEWLLSYDREQALVFVTRLSTDLNFWELAGFFQEGRRWLQRVLELTHNTGSTMRAQALIAAADLSSAIADFDYGLQCTQQAQHLFEQVGDQRGQIDARLKYYELAVLAGIFPNPQTLIEETLHPAEACHYPVGIAKSRLVIGTIAFYAGDDATAIQQLVPSITLWRSLNRPLELANALNRLAACLLAAKDYAAARQAFEESRDIYQTLGYRRGVALATQNIGVVAYQLGDYIQARASYCEALRIRHELGLQRGYTYSFEFIAEIDELEQRYERAVQLLAAATTLRSRLGAPIEPSKQPEGQEAQVRLSTQLGKLAFELAWAKGAALTTEQAIQLALG